MKVVALLSGGKDSCYSLLRSRIHGHEVVAVAHITPPQEEADSFMYQSVGSNVVPLIATALNLPLFTRKTNANAIESDLFYIPTEMDEVEDLVALLQEVKREHPEIEAVCSGALWSDYQRLRVESAASRVGLLSLSYLWRRDQKELLDEMIEAGVHAVLIKVAGMGLNSSHLGKSLEEMQPILHELEQKYGSHVCGEGGEFESLVLWMPGFQKRIVLDETETISHSEDPHAPVSYLRILSSKLADLTDAEIHTPLPSTPPPSTVFEHDSTWTEIIKRCDTATQAKVSSSEENDATTTQQHALNVTTGFGDRLMYLSIQSPKVGKEGVVHAASHLQRVLKEHGERLGSIMYVTLLLRSVSGENYKEANNGYNEVFATPECTPPPARACVAVSAENHPTTIEALVRRKRNKDAPGSFALHVQSLSEWAPPCIGPYAQFVEEDGVIHVSGVLPLYAPTASVPGRFDGKSQVAACLYNLECTLEASHANLRQIGLLIAYTTRDCLVQEVRNELEDLLAQRKRPHVVVAVLPVSALPKGALVEVRAVGVANREEMAFPEFVMVCEDDDEAVAFTKQSVTFGKLGYTVIRRIRPEYEAVDYVDIVKGLCETSAFPTDSKLISAQLYCDEAVCTPDVESKLMKLEPGAAMTFVKYANHCRSASPTGIGIYDIL